MLRGALAAAVTPLADERLDEEAFKRITDYLELEKETRQRIKAAIRYPAFVIVAIGVAIAVINIFVIPTFAELFAKANVVLPWQTRLLMATSDFFVTWWPLLAAGIIGGVIGFRSYIQTDKGRYWWDKRKLNLPIVYGLATDDAHGDLFRSTRSKFQIIKPGAAWLFDFNITSPGLRIRIRPVDLDRLNEFAVRGQYGPGHMDGESVPGYREEPRVAAESAVPTWAALRLFIDNWRWQGVPFYLRSSKRLAKRVTEIAPYYDYEPDPILEPRRLRPELVREQPLRIERPPDDLRRILLRIEPAGREPLCHAAEQRDRARRAPRHRHARRKLGPALFEQVGVEIETRRNAIDIVDLHFLLLPRQAPADIQIEPIGQRDVHVAVRGVTRGGDVLVERLVAQRVAIAPAEADGGGLANDGFVEVVRADDIVEPAEATTDEAQLLRERFGLVAHDADLLERKAGIDPRQERERGGAEREIFERVRLAVRSDRFELAESRRPAQVSGDPGHFAFVSLRMAVLRRADVAVIGARG